ncbi:jg24926, partial [Pararge aegeria aegeria]
MTVEIKTKLIEKKGNTYWKVTGFDYSYDLLDKVKIDLKNLYDGDEQR